MNKADQKTMMTAGQEAQDALQELREMRIFRKVMQEPIPGTTPAKIDAAIRRQEGA